MLMSAAFLFAGRKAAPCRGLTLPCQIVPNSAQKLQRVKGNQNQALGKEGIRCFFVNSVAAKSTWSAAIY